MQNYTVKLTGNDGFVWHNKVQAESITNAIIMAEGIASRLTTEQIVEVHAKLLV